jgi:hypothetical protein
MKNQKNVTQNDSLWNVFEKQAKMNREKLIRKWGPEVVLVCCRHWLSHYSEAWARCGECGKLPVVDTLLTWDDVLEGKEIGI